MPYFVIYESSKWVQRAMTVIDGQPFYQSTGKNSKNPGLWFPFVMLRGTKPLQFNPAKLPSYYRPKSLFKKKFERNKDHLVKLHVCINRNNPNISSQILQTQKIKMPLKTLKFISKTCLKELLITSHQLNVKNFPSDFLDFIKLNEREYQAIKSAKPIQLEAFERSPIMKNPDELNLWLINQGAKNITGLINPFTTPSPDEKKSMASTSQFFASEAHIVDLEEGTDKEVKAKPSKP